MATTCPATTVRRLLRQHGERCGAFAWASSTPVMGRTRLRWAARHGPATTATAITSRTPHPGFVVRSALATRPAASTAWRPARMRRRARPAWRWAVERCEQQRRGGSGRGDDRERPGSPRSAPVPYLEHQRQRIRRRRIGHGFERHRAGHQYERDCEQRGGDRVWFGGDVATRCRWAARATSGASPMSRPQ